MKYCKCGCGLRTRRNNDYIWGHGCRNRHPTEDAKRKMKKSAIRRYNAPFLLKIRRFLSGLFALSQK